MQLVAKPLTGTGCGHARTPVPCQNPPACRAWDRVTPGDRPRPGAGERSAVGLLGNLAVEVTARGRTNRVTCVRWAYGPPAGHRRPDLPRTERYGHLASTRPPGCRGRAVAGPHARRG